MNTPIKCCSPKIIIYPLLNTVWSAVEYIFDKTSGECYTCSGGSIPKQWLLFRSPYKLNINTACNYFAVTKSGHHLPVYVVVPCNHCMLCKQKRASEWSLRCLAENTLSVTRPIFATLTYEDGKIPPELLSVRDIQLFLKRLRINLERKYDTKVNLRYFLCSEYGKNTLRPHYHVIFWNWPVQFASFSSVHNDIKQAWQNGFVFVSNPDNKRGGSSCITYATKYMRKGCPKPRPDATDPFFLYSRRPGIGMGYLMKHLDFYREHQEVKTISIKDPYSPLTMTTTIPQTWRSKIHPSVSRIIPKEIRDAYGMLFNYRNFVFENCKDCRILYKVDNILHKFDFLSDYLVYDFTDSPSLPMDEFSTYHDRFYPSLFIEQFLNTLDSYQLDDYLCNLSLELFTKKIDLMLDSIPMQYNLDYLTEQCKKNNKKIEEKEIF